MATGRRAVEWVLSHEWFVPPVAGDRGLGSVLREQPPQLLPVGIHERFQAHRVRLPPRFWDYGPQDGQDVLGHAVVEADVSREGGVGADCDCRGGVRVALPYVFCCPLDRVAGVGVRAHCAVRPSVFFAHVRIAAAP
jgi:hypothetical protein